MGIPLIASFLAPILVSEEIKTKCSANAGITSHITTGRCYIGETIKSFLPDAEINEGGGEEIKDSGDSNMRPRSF